MIYFDKDKFPTAYKISDSIAMVDEAKWAKYAGTDKWDIIDAKFTVISDTDEYKEKQEQECRDQIKAEFIKTSLGLYRKQPKGYSNAVESVNVIFNMVNAMGSLTEQIASLVIFYPEPDFSDPKQCTEEWLIANSYNPEPMKLAEFMKFYIEFQTIWAAEQYKN